METVIFQKIEKTFYDLYTFWKVELEKNMFFVNRIKKVSTRDKLKNLDIHAKLAWREINTLQMIWISDALYRVFS